MKQSKLPKEQDASRKLPHTTPGDYLSKIEDEILSIVHLVGCQCHAAGWNDKLSGKDLDSLEEVERLEHLTVKELVALFEAIIDDLIGADDGWKHLNLLSKADYAEMEAWVKPRNQLRAEMRKRKKDLLR